jgi:hypothetical protein
MSKRTHDHDSDENSNKKIKPKRKHVINEDPALSNNMDMFNVMIIGEGKKTHNDRRSWLPNGIVRLIAWYYELIEKEDEKNTAIPEIVVRRIAEVYDRAVGGKYTNTFKHFKAALTSIVQWNAKHNKNGTYDFREEYDHYLINVNDPFDLDIHRSYVSREQQDIMANRGTVHLMRFFKQECKEQINYSYTRDRDIKNYDRWLMEETRQEAIRRGMITAESITRPAPMDVWNYIEVANMRERFTNVIVKQRADIHKENTAKFNAIRRRLVPKAKLYIKNKAEIN